MKALIFARVSTEEQKEAGNSLPAQIERLKTYCRNRDLEVLKTYTLDESAYKTNREEFGKFLNDVIKEAEKGKIAVCCDKIDRLVRNFSKDLVTVEELRTAGKIELHFPSDNVILHKDSPAADTFRFTMGVSLARYYSDSISDTTKRAFEQKRRNGEWMGKAPIGYLNVKGEGNTRNIIPDPAKQHYIKKIFELYGSGGYSTMTTRNEITKLGLKSQAGTPLSPSMISNILTNPFYYGEMLSKGELYPHKYTPLIDRSLYEACEKIRKGWKKQPFQFAAKPFVLRGLLKCARCGCAVSPEIKKGKYVYYSCTNYRKNCHREYVPESDLLKPILAALGSIKLPQKTIDYIVEGLKETSRAKTDFHKNMIHGLQKEYNDLDSRLDRLLDLRISNEITEEQYLKKVSNFKERQQEINLKLEEHTKADENYHITANTVLNLAAKAQELFISSEVPERRALLNCVLQNCTVDGKNLYFTLRSPFKELVDLSNQPIGLRG